MEGNEKKNSPSKRVGGGGGGLERLQIVRNTGARPKVPNQQPVTQPLTKTPSPTGHQINPKNNPNGSPGKEPMKKESPKIGKEWPKLKTDATKPGTHSTKPGTHSPKPGTHSPKPREFPPRKPAQPIKHGSSSDEMAKPPSPFGFGQPWARGSDEFHFTDTSESEESRNPSKKSSNSAEKNAGKEAYSGAVCRICMRGPPKSLITPCNCKGVYAYVHPACLSEWLETTGSDHCDICRFKYKMSKTPKSFCDWLKEENRSKEYNEAGINLALSLFILFIAFVLCWSIYDVVTPVLFWMLAVFTLIWIIYITVKLVIYGYGEISRYNQWSNDHYKVTVRENPDHGKVETASPPPNVARAAGFSPPTPQSKPPKEDPERNVQKVTKVPQRPRGPGMYGPPPMMVGGPVPYGGQHFPGYESPSSSDRESPGFKNMNFGTNKKFPKKNSSSSSELHHPQGAWGKGKESPTPTTQIPLKPFSPSGHKPYKIGPTGSPMAIDAAPGQGQTAMKPMHKHSHSTNKK